MAYVITITAATKAEASAKLDAEFDAVEASTAEHGHGREAVSAAARGMIDMLREPQEDERIAVELRGSVAGDPFAGCSHIGAYLNVTVGTLADTD